MVNQPHSLAFSIGKSKRSDIANSPMSKIVPGPGVYEQENKCLKAAPKWGFGSGTRPGMAEKQGTAELGPGQY